MGESNLLERWKPVTVSQIVGQPAAVGQLSAFANLPTTAAFIFHGPTGTGKTSAARALAFDLGCDRDDPYMGGLDEIQSGTQDGAAVQSMLRSLQLRPLFGSGWKVAIINEGDLMTPQAEAIWLDGLEHLPPKTVVIFTTNDLTRMASRFVSRCEVLEFHGSGEHVEASLHQFAKKVWKAETGKALRKIPDGLGLFDIAGGTFSFRLALQQLAGYIRTGQQLPHSIQAPIVRDSDSQINGSGRQAARKAWETRRNRKAVACV